MECREKDTQDWLTEFKCAMPAKENLTIPISLLAKFIVPDWGVK